MKLLCDQEMLGIIKRGISQEPLTGSFSDIKTKLRWNHHILTLFKRRQPPNGDYLKILKVE